MKYCLFFKLIDFVKITARIVKVNTLVSYLLVLVLVYIMRKSLDGREEDLSFRLERRSRRDTQKILNDLALTKMTQRSFLRKYTKHKKHSTVGLYCKSDKTEYQAFNQDPEQLCCIEQET